MSKMVTTHSWLGLLLAAGAVCVLAATGCASGPPQSGFLTDYSGFEELPEDAPIWEYVDPGGRRSRLNARIWGDRTNSQSLGKYDRLLIDPVVVHLRPGSEGAWVAPEKLNEITQYMRDALVAAFEDDYPVVDEPGEGVLRFRIAVTDIYPEYDYVTPDLDQHPVKVWANSLPGGASTEGEAIDSVSGERIMGLITSVRGSYYDSFKPGDEWEPSKRAIDGIARFFRKLMDDAHRAG